MTSETYRAMVVRQEESGAFVRAVETQTVDRLPAGDVLVRVHYSSLNFKDALSATGHRGVTRTYPHTPGIDAAGVVAEGRGDGFGPGDPVIVTSYDLGMNTFGGFGEYIRVPAGWVVPLPDGLTLKESMTYGTAGFTAGLAVHQLQQQGVEPAGGPVLVTGATGGLGSIAVAILAQEGYQVAAATGKLEREAYLRKLGASEIISREDAAEGSKRPLLSARWGGAVDAVGGAALATTLKTIQYGGTVASCGNAAGAEFETSVYPFILRAVKLLGIDSQNTPMALRREIWGRLAGRWKVSFLADMATVRTLDELEPEVQRILQGDQVGRVVVDLDA